MGGTIACPSCEGGLQPTQARSVVTTPLEWGPVDWVEVRLEDSSRLRPEDWRDLALALRLHLARPDVGAAVITHGTDTLEEAAYFIERIHEGDKPVCFTGAQRGSGHLSPDGPANLWDAVAVSRALRGRHAGCVVVFDSCIFEPSGLRKISARSLNIFSNGAYGHLGSVSDTGVRLHRLPVRRKPFPLPDLLPHVPLITEYPGSRGEAVDAAAASGANGLVIEALGAGNVGVPTARALRRFRDRGTPVVITTRVADCHVAPLYGGEGGGRMLQEIGCLFAPGFTPAQARIELALALGSGLPPCFLDPQT